MLSICSSGNKLYSLSSKIICPLVGFSKPAIKLINVVLPDPGLSSIKISLKILKNVSVSSMDFLESCATWTMKVLSSLQSKRVTSPRLLRSSWRFEIHFHQMMLAKKLRELQTSSRHATGQWTGTHFRSSTRFPSPFSRWRAARLTSKAKIALIGTTTTASTAGLRCDRTSWPRRRRSSRAATSTRSRARRTSRPFPTASRPSCVLLNVEHCVLVGGEQDTKYQLQTRNLKPACPGASESFFCYYM